MKVLILGANGKVGSKVARVLLEHGHQVAAGVHKNKEHVPKGATIIALDIANQESMRKSLEGCDAVVCTLSSWHAPSHAVLSQAMRTVIPAMDQAKVKRIVSVSGDVARLPHEIPSLFIRIFHMFAFGIVRKVVRDSEDHIRQLYSSDLDWTVLRPGVMTRAPHAAYRLHATHPLGMLVARDAVVAAIVDQIETPTHINQAPFISNR